MATLQTNGDAVIGPARAPADLAAISSLFTAYVDSLGIDLTFQDFPAELKSLPGKYGPPTGGLLLARDLNGTAIGCVGLRPLGLDGTCEMKRLYVTPAGRGLGLGKKLVIAIIDVAVRLGYVEMRLDTLSTMTEALSLYKVVGFEPTAPYYDTILMNTIFLAKDLRPMHTEHGGVPRNKC